MALCTALKIKVRIAYLDGRRADGIVDFVDIPEGTEMDKEPLTLLYRYFFTCFFSSQCLTWSK
jgi:hypothetical protein